VSLTDEIEQMKQRQAEIEKKLGMTEEQKPEKGVKKITLKIPLKLRKKVQKEKGASLALMLYHNKEAEFVTATYRDGLLVAYFGDPKDPLTKKRSYAYDEKSMFTLRVKKKRFPFVVFIESRLIPVGGDAEELQATVESKSLDMEKTIALAKQIGITNFGQQTIVREIEQSEVSKDEKKKGSWGWLIWVAVIVGIAFIAMKFFHLGGM
jgi:transcriptional regulator of met regulon